MAKYIERNRGANTPPGFGSKIVARFVRAVWRRSPLWMRETSAFRVLGRYVYRHVTRHDFRIQSHHTKFCRNVPQIETIRDLIARDFNGPDLRLASIGCSTGAELYSFLYKLRSSLPDMNITGVGVDLSPGVVDVARSAVYEAARPASVDVGLFDPGAPEADRLSDETVSEMFEKTSSESLCVRGWIRADTRWLVADAADSNLINLIGTQDVVLANNVFGPMDDDLVESCIRNLLKLVRPLGFLVVEGIDQDLRARLFPKLGLEAQLDRLDEVYFGDREKRNWPWDRWAHEPMDRKRADWRSRYSSIFKKA